MFKEIFHNIKTQHPLIHNITNYVTVNDCANILLAAGASPIMSDEEEEVAEITAICSALNVNIGTLNKNTIRAMFAAAKKQANCSTRLCLTPWAREHLVSAHKPRFRC